MHHEHMVLEYIRWDVRLSGPCLSVCEQSTIVAHEYLLKYGCDNFAIDHGLVGLRTKDTVEGVGPSGGKGDHPKYRARRGGFYCNILAAGSARSDNHGRTVLDFAV